MIELRKCRVAVPTFIGVGGALVEEVERALRRGWVLDRSKKPIVRIACVVRRQVRQQPHLTGVNGLSQSDQGLISAKYWVDSIKA